MRFSERIEWDPTPKRLRIESPFSESKYLCHIHVALLVF